MSTAFLEGSEYEQATQTYKSNLADIEAGDFVVVSVNDWGKSGYSLHKVDRVTKTQIVVGDKKFNRNGCEIGAVVWHKDCIYAPLDKLYDNRVTMLEVAESYTAERSEKARRTELTKFINAKLGNAPIETLQKIAELLGGA